MMALVYILIFVENVVGMVLLNFMSVMEHVHMVDGDGVCDELEIFGCQDSLAVNYNSLVTDSDPDLCDYIGCTDNLYFEFDSNATINDGSCETLIVYGCTNQDYLEYWSYDIISFSISNFDPVPNFDDGTCETLLYYADVLIRLPIIITLLQILMMAPALVMAV